MSMTVKFETTGTFRSGISKAQKPYFMCEAYAHLPGCPYPQKFSYYASAQNEVLPVGHYEADVTVSVKDDRLNFDVDARQARRIQPQVKAAS